MKSSSVVICPSRFSVWITPGMVFIFGSNCSKSFNATHLYSEYSLFSSISPSWWIASRWGSTMCFPFDFLKRRFVVNVVSRLILKFSPNSSSFSLLIPIRIDSSDVSIFPPGNENVPS